MRQIVFFSLLAAFGCLPTRPVTPRPTSSSVEPSVPELAIPSPSGELHILEIRDEKGKVLVRYSVPAHALFSLPDGAKLLPIAGNKP